MSENDVSASAVRRAIVSADALAREATRQLARLTERYPEAFTRRIA